ncbi:hypothetical protein BV898_19887 [Hypsibius exemplaris]|uniref:Uncharacterized protein n=1 Tax=Hypsibius exemplaris TaxID=2072580 RepID=A0A9X6NMD1_HYPEX|nr:hypothetical protein BV898_19887 [Hypsibius exemplaris]
MNRISYLWRFPSLISYATCLTRCCFKFLISICTEKGDKCGLRRIVKSLNRNREDGNRASTAAREQAQTAPAQPPPPPRGLRRCCLQGSSPELRMTSQCHFYLTVLKPKRPIPAPSKRFVTHVTFACQEL